MLLIRLRYLVCWFILLSEAKCVLTNVNDVTDLFDKEINNKNQYIDFLESFKARGIDNLKTLENNYDILGIDKNDQEIARLKSIKEDDLKFSGEEARTSPEYNFYDDGFEVNLTKPGNIQHRRDIERITKGTNNLMSNLMAKLQEIGISCKETNNLTERVPVMEIEEGINIEHDLDYNQIFCEELRNEYKCKEYLKVICESEEQKSYEVGDFTTELPKQYDSKNNTIGFGVNQNGTHIGGEGKFFTYTISFKVDDIDQIKEFTLLKIAFDDHVRVVLNGKQIFMGPLFGDRLEMVKLKDSKYHGVKINDEDKLFSIEGNTWHVKNLDLDIKPYLNNGRNHINITLAVGGYGGLYLELKTLVNRCKKWHDMKSEKCILK